MGTTSSCVLTVGAHPAIAAATTRIKERLEVTMLVQRATLDFLAPVQNFAHARERSVSRDEHDGVIDAPSGVAGGFTAVGAVDARRLR